MSKRDFIFLLLNSSFRMTTVKNKKGNKSSLKIDIGLKASEKVYSEIQKTMKLKIKNSRKKNCVSFTGFSLFPSSKKVRNNCIKLNDHQQWENWKKGQQEKAHNKYRKCKIQLDENDYDINLNYSKWNSRYVDFKKRNRNLPNRQSTKSSLSADTSFNSPQNSSLSNSRPIFDKLAKQNPNQKRNGCEFSLTEKQGLKRVEGDEGDNPYDDFLNTDTVQFECKKQIGEKQEKKERIESRGEIRGSEVLRGKGSNYSESSSFSNSKPQSPCISISPSPLQSIQSLESSNRTSHYTPQKPTQTNHPSYKAGRRANHASHSYSYKTHPKRALTSASSPKKTHYSHTHNQSSHIRSSSQSSQIKNSTQVSTNTRSNSNINTNSRSHMNSCSFKGVESVLSSTSTLGSSQKPTHSPSQFANQIPLFQKRSLANQLDSFASSIPDQKIKNKIQKTLKKKMSQQGMLYDKFISHHYVLNQKPNEAELGKRGEDKEQEDKERFTKMFRPQVKRAQSVSFKDSKGKLLSNSMYFDEKSMESPTKSLSLLKYHTAHWLKKRGIHCMMAHTSAKELLDNMFDEIDKEEKGYITKDELEGFLLFLKIKCRENSKYFGNSDLLNKLNHLKKIFNEKIPTLTKDNFIYYICGDSFGERVFTGKDEDEDLETKKFNKKVSLIQHQINEEMNKTKGQVKSFYKDPIPNDYERFKAAARRIYRLFDHYEQFFNRLSLDHIYKKRLSDIGVYFPTHSKRKLSKMKKGTLIFEEEAEIGNTDPISQQNKIINIFNQSLSRTKMLEKLFAKFNPSEERKNIHSFASFLEYIKYKKEKKFLMKLSLLSGVKDMRTHEVYDNAIKQEGTTAVNKLLYFEARDRDENDLLGVSSVGSEASRDSDYETLPQPQPRPLSARALTPQHKGRFVFRVIQPVQRPIKVLKDITSKKRAAFYCDTNSLYYSK